MRSRNCHSVFRSIWNSNRIKLLPQDKELSQRLLQLILFRAVVFLLWLNLGRPSFHAAGKTGTLLISAVVQHSCPALSLLCLVLWRDRPARDNPALFPDRRRPAAYHNSGRVYARNRKHVCLLLPFDHHLLQPDAGTKRGNGRRRPEHDSLRRNRYRRPFRPHLNRRAQKWILVKPHFEFRLMCLDFGQSPIWEHICIKDCGAWSAN